MDSPAAEPLSPTTGEPVSAVARRNRLGVWLIIVSCTTGTLALMVAYSYLWSLNVNSAWAPTAGQANWAPDWPFWVIALGMLIATGLLWLGWRAMAHGHSGRSVGLFGLASLLFLVCFIGQIVQIATFPFGPQDGAYASATLWFALANCIWLGLAIFLAPAIMNRARVGRITPNDASQARLVAMFCTYLCVAALLGALFTTAMKDSPNTNSPDFGTFQS